MIWKSPEQSKSSTETQGRFFLQHACHSLFQSTGVVDIVLLKKMTNVAFFPLPTFFTTSLLCSATRWLCFWVHKHACLASTIESRDNWCQGTDQPIFLAVYVTISPGLSRSAHVLLIGTHRIESCLYSWHYWRSLSDQNLLWRTVKNCLSRGSFIRFVQLDKMRGLF